MVVEHHINYEQYKVQTRANVSSRLCGSDKNGDIAMDSKRFLIVPIFCSASDLLQFTQVVRTVNFVTSSLEQTSKCRYELYTILQWEGVTSNSA